MFSVQIISKEETLMRNMHRRFYAVVLALSLAGMAACGVGSLIKRAEDPLKGAFGNRGFGGMSSTISRKTTAGIRWNGSIIPSAYADTVSTITMTGVYHGACDFPPGGLSSGTSYIPMNTNDCARGTLVSAFADPNGAAADYIGEPAIGSGTLSQLVVYGHGSGTVHVYVNRAGQVVDTGLQCTLSGTALNRCYDTTDTFTLSDGDMVVYVLGYDYTTGTASAQGVTAYTSKS